MNQIKLSKPLKNAWLLSFIDLTMLLIGFFIMMYSALSQNSMNHTQVLNSLKEKFSYVRQYNTNYIKPGIIYQILTKSIQENHLTNAISLVQQSKQISLLFNPGYLNAIGPNDNEYKKLIGFLSSVIYNFSNNKIELLILIANNKHNSSKVHASESIDFTLAKAVDLFEDISKVSFGSGLELNINIKNLTDNNRENIQGDLSLPTILLNIYAEDSK